MGIYDEGAKRVKNSKFVEFESGVDTRIRILTHPNVSSKQFKPTDPIRTQFAWVVWNYDLGKQQILQKGSGIFKRIGKIVKLYSEDMPMKCDLMITTEGSGLQTTYEIVAVPVLGTMPVLHQADILDLDTEVPNSIPLARFAQGEDPEVQTTDDVVPPKVADTLPTDDQVNKVNLDDIPF